MNPYQSLFLGIYTTGQLHLKDPEDNSQLIPPWLARGSSSSTLTNGKWGFLHYPLAICLAAIYPNTKLLAWQEPLVYMNPCVRKAAVLLVA